MLPFFPYPFLLGAALLLLLLAWLRLRRRASLAVCLIAALLGFYGLLIVSVTLFPAPVETGGLFSGADVRRILSRVNWRPFLLTGFWNPRILLAEVIANILMTVPIGFGVPFLTRSRRLRTTAVLSLAVGLGIEGLQLLLSLAAGAAYRTVDVNDVIWNGLGIWIGYLLFAIFAWLYQVAGLSRHLDEVTHR